MTRRYCGSFALLILALTLVSAGRAAAATPGAIDLPRIVPSFNQNYTDGSDAWGDCPLGTAGCPDQVRTTGCLITAVASVLAYYNATVTVSPEDSYTGHERTGMDPGILNDWLRATGGYGHCAQDPLGNCCLDWSRLPAGIELSFHSNRSEVSLNPVASVVIDHALRQGRPVLAGVHWGLHCSGSTSRSEDCHWIVLTGKVEEIYTIVDPFNPDHTSPRGVRTTLAGGVHGSYIIDRFVVVADTAARPSTGPPIRDEDRPAPAPADENAARSTASVVALLATIVALAIAVLVLATGRNGT